MLEVGSVGRGQLSEEEQVMVCSRVDARDMG